MLFVSADPSFSSSLSEFIVPTSSIIQASDKSAFVVFSFTSSISCEFLTFNEGFLVSIVAIFSFSLSGSIVLTLLDNVSSLIFRLFSEISFLSVDFLSSGDDIFSSSLSDSIVPTSSIIQASDKSVVFA